jgi:hypothetical protein
MKTKEFREYLIDDSNIESKVKAVNTRVSKAQAVENAIDKDLTSVVSSDASMYDALLFINKNMQNKNGSYSNALRHYYKFKNKSVFPRLKSYERTNRI